MVSVSRVAAAVFFGLFVQIAQPRGILPCQVWFTEFSPANPAATDSVGLLVRLPYSVGYFFTANTELLAKTEFLPPASVSTDIVVTDQPAKFVGYHQVNESYVGDAVFGYFGPVAAGQYEVTIDVRVPDGTGGYASLCSPDKRTLVVATDAAPVEAAQVVEFYNATLDHYFITQDAVEIHDLDTGAHSGWVRTGQSFPAYVAGRSDRRGRPVCRYYGLPSSGLNSHYFSASDVECSTVLWQPLTVGRWYEETSDAFEIALPDTVTGVCPQATVAVYRLWNTRLDSNHRYTTDMATKQLMVGKGYVPEGFGPDAVAMCAPVTPGTSAESLGHSTPHMNSRR
jgi:hypothetical protein